MKLTPWAIDCSLAAPCPATSRAAASSVGYSGLQYPLPAAGHPPDKYTSLASRYAMPSGLIASRASQSAAAPKKSTNVRRAALRMRAREVIGVDGVRKFAA